MDISVLQLQGAVPVTVLSPQGDLTVETYEQLQQQAEEAVKGGARRLVLDLGGVAYMSSSGLRAIHHIFSLLGRQEGAAGEQQMRQGMQAGTYKSPHFHLASPTRDVLQTLKMAGFDMFLEIHSDVRHAVDSFRKADTGVSA